MTISDHKSVKNRQGFTLKEIDKERAFNFIVKYHYSAQLPVLTKVCLGYFNKDGEMVGAISLGWGTRPKHTIKKFWEHMESADYFEIGKMAVADHLPKNGASNMLGLVIKWLRKNRPEVKVLFTWADGMLGKVGYVYQAANFYYAGYYLTDTYFTPDGERVHPRTSYKMQEANGAKVGRRPTFEQLSEMGWKHYKGKQFKYLYFLDRKLQKELLKSCKEKLSKAYPKEDALTWKMKTGRRQYIEAEAPYFEKSSMGVYQAAPTDFKPKAESESTGAAFFDDWEQTTLDDFLTNEDWKGGSAKK